MKLKINWMMAFFGTLISSMMGSVFAQNAIQCGFVQDSDQKAMCRAQAERNSAQCGFIKKADLRAMCRAQVDRNSAQCGFIKSADMRATCRALAGS